MNRPMPAAIPLHKLGLTASITASRNRTSASTMKITPDKNTIANAVCHACGTPSAVRLMHTLTKKKFSPMPGASAIG